MWDKHPFFFFFFEKTVIFIRIHTKIVIIVVGGKDLNFYVGPQASFTNKIASKEEKMFGKAP